jgi:ariadne-1
MDKLMEDPEAVSKKAGVTTTVKTPSSSQVLSPKSPSSPTRRSSRKPLGSSSKPPSRQASMITYTCPICCETGPTETLSLGCSHAFCSECWQTYLHTKIRDEGECAVRCMEGDCIVQVPSKFIKRVCTSEDYERYENLVVQDFVSHNSHLRFCPLPGCTYTVSCASATKSSLSTVVPTVKCAEGHFFCFGCHMEGDHRPCVCAVAKLWVKKCQDDSETANWIKSNTKECPKCNSTIEKNGGCK